MDSSPIRPGSPTSTPSSPAQERSAPETAHRKLNGLKVSALSRSAKLLPGTLETKGTSGPEARPLAGRGVQSSPVEPQVARSTSMPALHDQPKTAGEAIANMHSGILDVTGGGVQVYGSLLSQEMPYDELRQLAWNSNLNSGLPTDGLHIARQAWAARKTNNFLSQNPGLPLDQAKQKLTAELTKRQVPQRYVMEAMTALDSSSRGKEQTASVSTHAQQIYYMMNISNSDAMSDTGRMVAFSQTLDRMSDTGKLSGRALERMASDIEGTPDLEAMPVNITLLMALNKINTSGDMDADALESPPPLPPKRPASPKPPPRADQLAGVGSKLTLNHTPSLSAAEIQQFAEAGITTVPIKLNGKEVAYLFTSSPDGTPKDRVLFSCHASGREQRAKFQKDPTTMLFAGTRDNILRSRTLNFAEGLASGRARFEDESQIYAKVQREVTDYSIGGGINTNPAMAVEQLVAFREQGVVNDFDYLLLDRNADGLHLSDLMQALKESGIKHTQMINHLCRPQTRDAGRFYVAETMDNSSALHLSTIDPDLNDLPPPVPPRG